MEAVYAHFGDVEDENGDKYEFIFSDGMVTGGGRTCMNMYPNPPVIYFPRYPSPTSASVVGRREDVERNSSVLGHDASEPHGGGRYGPKLWLLP